jgi:hypothetical protein
MRFLTLVAATVAAAALMTLQHASAFTVVNQGGNSGGGAQVADPDEQVRSNVGAQGRSRGAAPARNVVPMFSGVMPDTHDILPPPASLFQTAPPTRAKAKVTVKPVNKSVDASPANSTVRDMSQPLAEASR